MYKVDKLFEFISKLSGLDREVILLRKVFKQSLLKTSKNVEQTRERVRQIEARVCEDLDSLIEKL
jgi:DNA-directed RNA polymerase sigma subunit (sigma70/sigma32)